MEVQNISPVPSAMRWGAILGLVGVATSTLNFAMGGFAPENQDSGITKIIQFAMYAIIILVLVVATQQHRDRELGGFMSYGRGLGLGALIGLFYGLIASLTTFVILQYLMPIDYADKMMEVAQQKMMEGNPNMTEEQAEMGLSMARKFMTPSWMSIFVLLGSVFMCFFFSLIVSAFVKKSNPDELN
jgi:hypothetical protein